MEFTTEQILNMSMDEFHKLRAGLIIDHDCPNTAHGGVHLITTNVDVRRSEVRSYCTACGFVLYKETF
jgi:hypothetical protein